MSAQVQKSSGVKPKSPEGQVDRTGKKPTIVQKAETGEPGVTEAPKAKEGASGVKEAKIDSDSLSAALFELFPNAPAALLDMIAMDASLGDADTPEALAEMLEGDVLDSLPGETPKAKKAFVKTLAKKAFEKKAETQYNKLPPAQ